MEYKRLTMTRPPQRLLTYVGVFLIAQATLMLEIVLTRILSVVGWARRARSLDRAAGSRFGAPHGRKAVLLQPPAAESVVSALARC